MTAAEMRQALALERQAREQACLKELEAVLKKHSCQWAAVPVFTEDGRTVATLRIVALE